MSFFSLILILAVIIIIIIFIPDLFPYCGNCKRVKLRSFFRIHKIVGIKLGYSSNKSVCRKCCQKYGIYTYREYEELEKARRKIKIHMDAGL
jgi:hypothetical protein